jgi:hypothetical protein
MRAGSRSAGLIGLLVAVVVAAGCGSTAVNSAVEHGAQAACLSASANVPNRAAKKAADQACRAVGSGNTHQLTQAAIGAARQACLLASQQITNSTARNAARAACPSGKSRP